MQDDIRTALNLILERIEVHERRLDGQRQAWDTEQARHDRQRDQFYAELDAARAEIAHIRAIVDAAQTEIEHTHAVIKTIVELLIPIETRTDNTQAELRLAVDRIAELEREVGGA